MPFTLSGGFQDVEDMVHDQDRFDVLEAVQEVQHHVHSQARQVPDLSR